MSYILNVQRKRNISTARHWGYYEGHRRHVMSLLKDVSGGSSGRICMLGAGNCNDIDLALLSEWFADIHLVDWDADSLRAGIEKQGISPESVTLHSGVELTGVGHYMERWKKTSPSNDDINQVIALLSEPYSIGIESEFDVVVSGSLLTQLIEYPVALLGRAHPRTEEVAVKIRAAHFRLMASLLAPGGTGVLVTELISSDTCEELKHCPDNKLSELQFQLVQQKKCFVGTNSHELIPALRTDPLIASQIGQTRLTDPWRWQIGPDRYFLAYGFVFGEKEEKG